MTIKRVSRKVIADNRGVLMPFNLDDAELNSFKRVFCTADLKKGEARGSHAHRTQTQLLYVIQGEFKITFENSSEKGEVLLNNYSEGIEIPIMTWSTQTPTKDHSVLIVFASDVYEETDYIRDYGEFKTLSNRSLKK
jgi:dTDP-4-dehydrorhamnose 3,5-epimerase-like enzyme